MKHHHIMMIISIGFSTTFNCGIQVQLVRAAAPTLAIKRRSSPGGAALLVLPQLSASPAAPRWMQKIHYILVQGLSAKFVAVVADPLRNSMPSPTIHLAASGRRGCFPLPLRQHRRHTENKRSATLKAARSCYPHLMFKKSSPR